MPAATPTRKGPESWSFIRPEVKAVEKARVMGGSPARLLVGLSFSGGGIRSATFNLGVLQALRSLGVFAKIDYLSTVSGGGYIGGWLQGILARGRLIAQLAFEISADIAAAGERVALHPVCLPRILLPISCLSRPPDAFR